MADMGVIPPGAGHMLTARGSVMAFKAVAAQTGADFSLMERTLPPGGRKPPAHRAAGGHLHAAAGRMARHARTRSLRSSAR